MTTRTSPKLMEGYAVVPKAVTVEMDRRVVELGWTSALNVRPSSCKDLEDAIEAVVGAARNALPWVVGQVDYTALRDALARIDSLRAKEKS